MTLAHPCIRPACLPYVGTVELQKLNRRDPGAKRLGRMGEREGEREGGRERGREREGGTEGEAKGEGR